MSEEKKRAIRHLLDENDPADALAAYYAFHHSAGKTGLIVYPPDAGARQAVGYVAFSRTGRDLFRPFLTMRLPIDDMKTSVDIIHSAMPPATAVIAQVPAAYFPLMQALFHIDNEEHLELFKLDPARFEPIINVMVTQAESPNGLPRFVIRSKESGSQEVVASAMLNWQSPKFAEIAINTSPRYQRQGWGKSVLAAMAQYLRSNGRWPLYAVNPQNEASRQLAHSVGFVATTAESVLFQGTLRELQHED